MSEHPIALVICDIWLPGMGGIEVLQQAQRLRPNAVRIALTAHSDLQTVLKTINIGHVSQFIVKPWDEFLLIQTVATSLERYRLVNENQNLHSLILSQHRELEKAHEKLRYEMQLGARIHEEMLLGKVPEGLPGISIAATTVPSDEIDGDIFVFYSDGVSESRSPSNEAYGVDRISDIVRTSCMESAQEILDRIRRSILAFAQQDKFIDDATLIITKMLKERKFKLETSTFPRKSRCIKLEFQAAFSELNLKNGQLRAFCSIYINLTWKMERKWKNKDSRYQLTANR